MGRWPRSPPCWALRGLSGAHEQRWGAQRERLIPLPKSLWHPPQTTPPKHQFAAFLCILSAETNAGRCTLKVFQQLFAFLYFNFFYSYKQTKKEIRNWERRRRRRMLFLSTIYIETLLNKHKTLRPHHWKPSLCTQPHWLPGISA